MYNPTMLSSRSSFICGECSQELNRDQAAACFDNRKEARRISHRKRIVGCLLEPIKSWMRIQKTTDDGAV